MSGHTDRVPATVAIPGVGEHLAVRSWHEGGLVVELPDGEERPSRGRTVELGWADGTGWVSAAATVRCAIGDLLHLVELTIVERVQRRGAARLRCSWPVSVTTYTGNGPRAELVEIVDLSATGVAVGWTRPLASGDRLPLVMYPPDSRALTLVGEVVTVGDGRLRLRFVGYGDQVEPDLARMVAQLLTRRVRP